MASKFAEADFYEHAQRYGDKELDWKPFADQGELNPTYKRAHVRMVGASITGNHTEPGTIPSENFTLSVMMMPPGAEAPSHAHEVEEVFFVVEGELTAWWEHDDGTILEDRSQGAGNDLLAGWHHARHAQPHRPRGAGSGRHRCRPSPKAPPTSTRPWPEAEAAATRRPRSPDRRPAWISDEGQDEERPFDGPRSGETDDQRRGPHAGRGPHRT